MLNITTSQKRKLKESCRRGIVRELYEKSIISEGQYKRLMQRS